MLVRITVIFPAPRRLFSSALVCSLLSRITQILLLDLYAHNSLESWETGQGRIFGGNPNHVALGLGLGGDTVILRMGRLCYAAFV